MVVHGGSTAVPETQTQSGVITRLRMYTVYILAAITERLSVPGSYSVSCQNERLFLFGQAVESLQTRVEPAGSLPFLPGNTSAQPVQSGFDSVRRLSCAEKPAEDLRFPKHWPGRVPPHAGTSRCEAAASFSLATPLAHDRFKYI